MAYQLTRSGNKYIEASSSPITGYPFTMCGWFYADTLPNWETALGFWNSGDSGDYLILYFHTDGNGRNDEVGYYYDGGLYQTTSVLSSATWHHLLVSSANSTTHRIVVNGGVFTSSTNFGAFPTNTEMGIGGTGAWSDEEFDGRVAEVGVWNVALSPADEQQLALGVSPALIRSDALVSYPPLIRNLGDRFGTSWSGINSPTAGANHVPGVMYPASLNVGLPGEAAPPAARRIMVIGLIMGLLKQNPIATRRALLGLRSLGGGK